MATELQQQKLDKAFTQLDVSRNGHVDHGDVVALAAHVMSAFEVLPSSDKGKRLMDSFDGIWQAVLAKADLDGDDRLDPAEWRAAMDSAFIASDETYERVFNPAVLAAWDLADSNGDGVVGFDEFSAFQRAFGTAPADARAAFDAIDTNGDGVLSTDEISVYARQFYVGADENAVGNLFYGPLAAAS